MNLHTDELLHVSLSQLTSMQVVPQINLYMKASDTSYLTQFKSNDVSLKDDSWCEFPTVNVNVNESRTVGLSLICQPDIQEY